MKIKLYAYLAARYLIYGLQTLTGSRALASTVLELNGKIALLDGAIYKNDVRRKLVRVRPISEDK